MHRRQFAFVVVLAACGGSSQSTVNEPVQSPGATHVAEAPPAPAAPDVAAPAPGEPAARPAPPEDSGAAMIRPSIPRGTTIELKNEGDGDLMFAVTKGWQPVIFAYTGKPPKAKPVLLFASHCTASCDAPEGEVCPVCAEPKTKKEEAKMAKYETAAAGRSVLVPWDGKVFLYAKSAGKKSCKCWSKADPPADSYTIKACGLRPSTQAGKPSKPVCAETQVALGGGAGAGQTITLTFPK
jgi:hypothetical protein